jgi:hypothetical protein
MSRATWIRQTTTWTSVCIMTGFGLTSVVSAQHVIRDTGPHSVNTIRTNIDTKCKIENTNDISVRNTNDQDAESGKAVVADNTSAREGHDFHESDLVNNIGPEDRGRGLDRILSNTGHDGDNGGRGDAITGDATNHNDTSLAVDINNTSPLLAESGVCAPANSTACRLTCNRSNNFRNNTGTRAANAFSNGVARNAAPAIANVANAPGVGAGVGSGEGPSVGAPDLPVATPEIASAPVGGFGGANAFENSSCGSTCGCSSACSCESCGGAGAGAISDTGPYSENSIKSNLSDTTIVKNTNDIVVTNANNQTATSGNSTVTDNTSAGDAGSGGAGNGNATDLGVSATN